MRAIALSLPLLVLLIGTNDADDAAAPHDLALVANPFHRCSNLHSFSTIRPRVTSPVNSMRTRSPTRILTKFRSTRSAMCAMTNRPPSSRRTLYIALGSVSVTRPTAVARPVRSSFDMLRTGVDGLALPYRNGNLSRRQNPWAVRRHRHRVLEMRRQAVIARDRGPAVAQHFHRRLPGV